jgi:hypothetical protein
LFCALVDAAFDRIDSIGSFSSFLLGRAPRPCS